MFRHAVLISTLLASANLVFSVSARAQDFRAAPDLAGGIEQVDLRVRRPRPSLGEAAPHPAKYPCYAEE